MLLVGVPARHRSVPRDRGRAAHRSPVTLRSRRAGVVSTPSSIACERADRGRLAGRPGASGAPTTISRSGGAVMVAESAPLDRAAAGARLVRAARLEPGLHAELGPVDRRGTGSRRPASAESSSSDLQPGDHRGDLRAWQRRVSAASRRPSGCPSTSVLELPTRPARVAAGTVAHRSAGASGGIAWSGCGLRELPHPARRTSEATTIPRPPRRRAVACIGPPRRCWLNPRYSTTGDSAAGRKLTRA